MKFLKQGILFLVLVAISLEFSSKSQATTSNVSARLLISKLKVAVEHDAGYQRHLFTLWIDANHDGCNTRKEVLLAEAIIRPREAGHCTLLGGKWRSAYDGQIFTNARGMDIDHMVPLEEAWASGAYKWDSATREAYANDLGYARSLIAVSATANRSKSASDPWLWMPPLNSDRCQYINDWVAIKYRWNLAVDPTEKRDLIAKLRGCGGHTFVLRPARASVHLGAGNQSTGGSGTGFNGGGTVVTHHHGMDPRYSSCVKAKAAGLGPYYRGRDTEYNWYRDGDSDGVTCE
jgi:Protein of unknown function (DUF1524)/Excalibur calcium-binding domain